VRWPTTGASRSTYDPATRHLRLAAAAGAPAKSFDVDAERSALEEWLSEFFGFPAFFRENTGAGFPDDTDSPGPTLISTATLREVAGWFNLSMEQVRARFRSNLEVDGVPPFWEDQLFGERGTTVRFSVGDVLFDGVNPCQRCIVPARDPQTASDVRDFAKRFVEMRKKRLPNWAEVSRFNHFYRLAVNTKLTEFKPGLRLSVGDPINIIGRIVVAQTAPAPAPVAAKPSRWSGALRVQGIFETTPTVRTFRLGAVGGGPLPFTYLPGQFLNIEPTVDGSLHRRCYTIASSPTQPDYCEITVKHEQGGVVSRHLHEKFKEGMHLNVAGPSGRFTFTGEEADGIVLIGAGVGITPLMSVIRYLMDRNWPGTIDLIYSAKTEREIIFRDELRALAKACPNLRVTITLTQESGTRWTGSRGRLSAELLRQAIPDWTNRRVHICGPVEMADQCKRMLSEIGVAPEQIQSEAFGGAMPAATIEAGDAREVIGSVTFTESGKVAPAYRGQSILETASCSGISIDRGCMAGICGRCKVRLLTGDVKMDADEALTPDELRGRYILSCQSRPLGNVAIEA
jgi:ferredoxin-NADP reductase/uncharacterized protein YcbX